MVRKAAIGAAALAVAAALGGGWAAMAQQPAASGGIMLTEGEAPYQVTVVGSVRAEIHQKSIMPKQSNKELADADLRAQAKKLGADAVIKIVYEPYNAALSTKGFIAHGVAVKYVRNGAPAATPAAAPAPAAASPPQQVTQAAPPPAPMPAPAPVAAPAAVRSGPTPAGMIVIREDDQVGPYTRLGEVKTEAHQKSLFSKKPARTMLEEQLKAEAAKLGADAVIMVKYDMNSPMFSKEGSRATGIAVKLNGGGAAAPAAAPALAASAAPAPGAPMPVAANPMPAVRSGPTPAGMIVLREDDAVGPYYRLGTVSSEAHQKSLMSKRPARVMLDDDLRAKAARMGADAVINIKYDMNSPMFSKEGSKATGVAVKLGSTAPPMPVAAPAYMPATAAAAPAPAAPGAAPAAPRPAVSYPPRTGGATPVDLIELSMADNPRPYIIVGQVNAEARPAPGQSPRSILDETLRQQAAGLGADAVVQIRYEITNPAISQNPSHAGGTAVRWK